MLKNINNCIIIGSGPAGYTAGIYASRAELKPILYTGSNHGGQINTTTLVENYPGFHKGIMGPDLIKYFKKQAERFGTIIKFNNVVKVNLTNIIGGVHKIYLNNKNIIKTYGVIVATGALPKYLGLRNELRLRGYGVSNCAVCDGFFYKKKRVVIVGGGDSSIESVIYLSKICEKIYLVVRKNNLKASKIMQKRIFKIKNLEILFNHEIQDVIGDKVVSGIKLINNKTQCENTINVSGIFITIGNIPNTKIFENQLNLDEKGYIITKKINTKTNIPGVFACGDVQDHIYRQAITSAGTGCMAALDLEKYLSIL